MLDSLEIKNYRNLKDLRITSLRRVNLITGRNNTGKSTLLEAISLYASRCNLNLVTQLLEERGENYKPLSNNLSSLEASIKAFSSLFNKRDVSYSIDDCISIGTLEDTLFGRNLSTAKSISIRFVKYVDEISNVNEGSLNILNRRKRAIVPEEEINSVIDFHIGLELRDGNYSYIMPLDDERTERYRIFTLSDNCEHIRTRNIDREVNGKLWDLITLTENEDRVINALKIIDTNVERLAYIDDNGRERKAVIKIKGDNNVVPLKSMGDGMNRILTIILALVNSDNGYLLIDEFENGLHYSVQEKLWEIIFKLSESLNVQVFATTHSEDCIRGFESVLNSGQNSDQGKLIRLDNIKGTIKQTEYDARELKIASENDIETR